MHPRTAWLALLLGPGIAAAAASASPADSSTQFEQHSVKVGTVTYKLPDNWVFIKTKCTDTDQACRNKAAAFLAKYQDSKGNDYSFLSNQNWLQCLGNCPGGSASSGFDLDYCMQSPSCMKDIQGTLAAAQAEAAMSADPQNAPALGEAYGQTQAAPFLENPNQLPMLSDDTSSSRLTDKPAPSHVTSADGQVLSKGGPPAGRKPSYSADPTAGGTRPDGNPAENGSAQGDPTLAYARRIFPESLDSGMDGTTEGIVQSSPFLDDHRRFYLASNSAPTDLHALEKVGSDIINPISQQVIGDGTSGRTAFDGQSANLPKDAKRRCGTNFFGVENCPK